MLENFDLWRTFLPVRTSYIHYLTWIKVGVKMPGYNATEHLWIQRKSGQEKPSFSYWRKWNLIYVCAVNRVDTQKVNDTLDNSVYSYHKAQNLHFSYSGDRVLTARYEINP